MNILLEDKYKKFSNTVLGFLKKVWKICISLSQRVLFSSLKQHLPIFTGW